METEEKSKSLAKHSVNYCNTHMGSKIKYSDSGYDIGAVYDSNLLQDKRSGFELNFEICALQVKKLENVNGKDKFEYLYYPLKGRNNIIYMASSNQGLMSTNAIVILDENWNVFK